MQRKYGFTLIELLVVIAIIALLSSVVLATLSTARAKARDARRYSDMEQIATALELYYDTQNSYPSTTGIWLSACPKPPASLVVTDSFSKGTSGPGGYIPNLAPTYIPILPTDPGGCNPQPPAISFVGYIYTSDGADYKFGVNWSMEYGQLCVSGEKYFDAVRVRDVPTGRYFCSMSSPGARLW
jgi:prepilin-type N-terminal cleavage/methylation domain-containing protein